MSFSFNIPFDNPENYSYNPAKVEIADGEGKLKASPAGDTDTELFCKLDDSELVAFDSSGNNRHGTLSGTFDASDWTTGKINGGIEGDNTGYIVFGDILDFERTDTFTIEFWIKYTTAGVHSVLGKRSSSGNTPGYEFLLVSGKLRLTLREDGPGTIGREHPTALNDDTFYHIVATYDGSSSHTGMQLFVNGVDTSVAIETNPLTGTMSNSVSFNIGTRDTGGLTIPTGTVIDEVVVYPKVLGTAEIAFRYNSGAGTQDLPQETSVFPLDNPTIVPFSPILMDELVTFAPTTTVSATDEFRYTMEINGVDTWYDGGAWVASAGYAESNTEAEIVANIDTLLVDTTLVNTKIFLHSDDGTTTPAIQELGIVYERYSSQPVTPAECLVSGFVFNNQGLPVSGIVVTAKLNDNYTYSDDLILTVNEFTSVTDEAGRWEMSLVENENMSTGASYRFCFKGANIQVIENRVVPNELTKNYTELVTA